MQISIALFNSTKYLNVNGTTNTQHEYLWMKTHTQRFYSPISHINTSSLSIDIDYIMSRKLLSFKLYRKNTVYRNYIYRWLYINIEPVAKG